MSTPTQIERIARKNRRVAKEAARQARKIVCAYDALVASGNATANDLRRAFFFLECKLRDVRAREDAKTRRTSIPYHAVRSSAWPVEEDAG